MSSSRTVPGSTSTTRTRSTPRRRWSRHSTSCGGTRRGEQVMLDAARLAQNLPGNPIVLYKNNTDNKGASYGAHENYLMRRSTPFADIVKHLTPVLREPAGLLRRRTCRQGPGRARPGLPDQPARRLLRGRGGPRDHPQATDHQHARRAARRPPREVPPVARDHRRRQPRRDRDLPQGRHHLAGAGDDRGPVHLPRPHRRPAGRLAARGVPRPDAAPRGDPCRRSAPDGGSSCSWSTSTSRRSTSRTAMAPMRTRRPSTSSPGGRTC